MKITIDSRYCKGCNVCIDVCPKKVFESSNSRSNAGYLMPEVAHAESCINCALCERLCPDTCINVEKEGA